MRIHDSHKLTTYPHHESGGNLDTWTLVSWFWSKQRVPENQSLNHFLFNNNTRICWKDCSLQSNFRGYQWDSVISLLTGLSTAQPMRFPVYRQFSLNCNRERKSQRDGPNGTYLCYLIIRLDFSLCDRERVWTVTFTTIKAHDDLFWP